MRLLLIALACVSCTTQGVRDRTLLPAINTAYVGVRADAVVGGAPGALLDAWDIGIETGALLGLDVVALEGAALAGVAFRLSSGEIGPNGAAIMRDRAVNFRLGVEEYLRSVRYVRAERRGPVVISRSSWSTHPPSAIAGVVYR